MSEVNAFRSDESGGNLDVWPLLAVGYVDLISVGENLRGSTMETRKKAPSEILNEEEVNTERAVHAGRRRAGHLGELRNVSWPLVLMPLPFPSAILKWIRYNGLSHTLALSMGILLGHCSALCPCERHALQSWCCLTVFERSLKEELINIRQLQTNGHDTFRSAERNGAAKGTVADLR